MAGLPFRAPCTALGLAAVGLAAVFFAWHVILSDANLYEGLVAGKVLRLNSSPAASGHLSELKGSYGKAYGRRDARAKSRLWRGHDSCKLGDLDIPKVRPQTDLCVFGGGRGGGEDKSNAVAIRLPGPCLRESK